MATITYTVTVASGTNRHGTGNKFYLNGTVSPDINLIEGNTYIFDQSDSTNDTHRLGFSTTDNGSWGGGSEYTTGVTVTGTPGTDGKTTIVVAAFAPTLYYYCVNHTGMGATAYTLSGGETSETTTFEKTFPVDDVVEEAYERLGYQNVTGYHLKSARKSLNILLQEWGNRGLHYWEVDETNVDLVQGQSDYDFYRSSGDGSSATTAPTNNLYGLSDILEAQLRNNRGQTTQSDSPMTKVDRSTYAGFSNKLSQGTPNQYWVERFVDKVRLHVYPTPDSTNASKEIHFYYTKRIQDAGNYDDVVNVPYRFVPCMCAGLAFYLSQKYTPERSQQLKLYYEDEFQRALQEDGSASSTYITPKAYYPGT